MVTGGKSIFSDNTLDFELKIQQKRQQEMSLIRSFARDLL